MPPDDLGITFDQIVTQVQSYVSIPVVPVIIATVLAIGLVVIVAGAVMAIVDEYI